MLQKNNLNHLLINIPEIKGSVHSTSSGKDFLGKLYPDYRNLVQGTSTYLRYKSDKVKVYPNYNLGNLNKMTLEVCDYLGQPTDNGRDTLY